MLNPFISRITGNVYKADSIDNQTVAENFVDIVVHCGIGHNRQHNDYLF